MAETLRTRAGTAGLEVVYSEFYSNGTIDHSAALAKIKGLAPDWIYITGYSQDLILARKQMHDIGLDGAHRHDDHRARVSRVHRRSWTAG